MSFLRIGDAAQATRVPDYLTYFVSTSFMRISEFHKSYNLTNMQINASAGISGFGGRVGTVALLKA